MVIIIIFDPSTIAFATFFVGALVGVIVPQLANLDPSPAVQQSVQLFLAFMAVMASAIAGGLAAPAVFVGLFAGYTFALQANMKTKLRRVEGR